MSHWTNQHHWTGRDDKEDGERGFRWHHVVQQQSPENLLEQTDAIVLAGFACDIGVANNKGRIGAKQGPKALRQALANQAQLSAQRASASIGQQEAANRKLAAQEASRLQQLSRQGAFAVQQMQADKQATQLGMSMQQVANAQEAIAARQQMIGNIVGGVSSAVGSLFAGTFS